MRLGRDICGTLGTALTREWLVTNGLGGYAAGTVAGIHTRRYHGMLMAALEPPLGRTLLVAKLDATASYLGGSYPLDANEYHDGTIDPHGYVHIERFELDGGMAVWRYAIADAVLERRIWMAQGQNTSYVRYTLQRASAALELEVLPLVTYRDYHSHRRGSWPLAFERVPDGVEVRAHPDAVPYRLLVDRGQFHPDADWHWGFRHRVEAERGLDEVEDLFRPGRFKIRIEPGQCSTLILSAEETPPRPARESLTSERNRQIGLLAGLPPGQPAWIRQLALAADQFVVRRGDGAGRTVIAGYPWFGDWGRDTMIALPGLTLATGRLDVAAQILRTFADHVSDGMVPNRFPDSGETPEYNTADATLWYLHAVDRFFAAGGDPELGQVLYPVLSDIIDWHLRGTRYQIQADLGDGLLYAGEPGVQLTWMDAKVGDWVVTPRIGKPVEINALWHNALVVMGGLAGRLGDADARRHYLRLAERVRESFCERYWFERGQYLYDVVDGPEGEQDSAGRRCDATLRPNQIFAVSLPASLLDERKARSVVEVCGRELGTSLGLRSLAQTDSCFVGRYGGTALERDGAYHQGTVWSWLLGPFVSAHFKVHGDAALARDWLSAVASHLADAGLGSVSEILDGSPPHHPRGCTAQAWSVAEILRAWLELPEESNDG